jgi:subtilisin family serine protease
MPEQTYFYRDGERREVEKATDIIAISFLKPTPWPEDVALTEAQFGSTNLRRITGPRPRFGVYQLDRYKGVRPARMRECRDRAMTALRAIDRTVFVSHAYRTDPDSQTNVLVLTDEIVAEIPDVTLPRLREIVAGRGVRYVRTIDRSRRIFLLKVTAAAGMNALKVANRLVEEGVAAAAEPNFVRRFPYRGTTRRGASPSRGPDAAVPRKTPSDPLFKKQWHLENSGQTGGTRGADIAAPVAWARTMGSPEITIAIVDDGLDLEHEEFRAKGKILPGYNFQDKNDDPSAIPLNRHGTACAGLAAALADNEKGGCGVAPGCRLLPIRTPDEWGDEVGYADAVAWAAEKGADVISCSWGPPDGYWSDDPLPLAMSAAFDRATGSGRGGRGTVICWAAGNGNEPVDLDGFASDPRVIAVGATDDRDRKASYSDFGAGLSVCAPGGDTLTGRSGIVTTDLSGASGYGHGNYTSDFGGTSAAAPIAAGVVALVLSANPALTASQVKSLLQETAEKVDAGGEFTDARGKAHPTRYAEGRSLAYGFGRLNAGAAVARAEELREASRRARPAKRGGRRKRRRRS